MNWHWFATCVNERFFTINVLRGDVDNTLEIFFPQPCVLFSNALFPANVNYMYYLLLFHRSVFEGIFFSVCQICFFSYKFDTNGFLMHSDFSLTNIIFFSQQYLAINEAAYIAFLLILWYQYVFTSPVCHSILIFTDRLVHSDWNIICITFGTL